MKKFPILLVLGIVASLWFMPFMIDWVRYQNLPVGCSEVFTYSGNASDVALSGRHCTSGTSILSTEAGFFVTFEIARDGRLMSYGKRTTAVLESSPCTNGACDLGVSLFRPPADNKWYCATGGTYSNPGSALAVTMSGVSALSTKSSDQTLEAVFKGGLRGKLTIAGKEMKEPGLWGKSCDQDTTRCDFLLGDERAYTRVYIRTAESMRTTGTTAIPIEDVFVVQQDGRHPKSLTLMQAGPNSGSTILYDGDKLTLALKGLSEPATCANETPGTGTISAAKSTFGF